MSNIVQWFEARTWQVGAIAASTVAAGLAVALTVTSFQKAGLERDLATEKAAVATAGRNLDRCHTNVDTLKAKIDDQNAEIMRIARAGADKLRLAEDAVAAARSQNTRLNARIDLLLKTPALGATPCERFGEIDTAVQEAFQ